jgi:hypothetical protein
MKTTRWAASDPVAVSPTMTTNTTARVIAKETFRVGLLGLFSFCCVLAVCVFMAGTEKQVQRDARAQPLQWYSSDYMLSIVNQGKSSLRLTKAGELDLDGTLRGPSQYAVCDYRYHGLDVVDFTMISLATYMRPVEQTDVPGLLRAMLPHRNLTVRKHSSSFRNWVEVEIESCTGPNGNGRPSHCRPISVVAVSGTDPSKIQDILECIRMWTEPVALELLAMAWPTARMWPRESTAMVIGSIFKFLKLLEMQDDQWHYQDILDHVRHLPADREVVMTGHSLGGGIALVVGALTGHQAVAIQPPGLWHALAKHAEQHGEATVGRHLHKRSLSVLVEHDFISYFDGHGGMVQTLLCDRPNESAKLGCHMIERTLCHLVRECGDHIGRFSECHIEQELALKSGTKASRFLAKIRNFLDLLRESWDSCYLYFLAAQRNVWSLIVSGAAVTLLMSYEHYRRACGMIQTKRLHRS